MTERSDPGVDATVARRGGVSYLRIPALDVRESAAFYQAVFGWDVSPERGSFADGTGHVIGHWAADRATAGDGGVVPYIYVESVEETLGVATSRGAMILREPYAEGNLTIATLRDPGGNEIGVWQERRA